MNKPQDPKELALDLLDRSVCSVQVAAVFWDSYGIFSWGFNHAGFDGMGEHAEIATIRRANRCRLLGASIAIVGRRKRNHKTVTAFPCTECMARLTKVEVSNIWLQDKSGAWFKVRI